jgi:protein required for attachment to host cells
MTIDQSTHLVTHVLIADHAVARLLRVVGPQRHRSVELEELLEQLSHKHAERHRLDERFVAHIAQQLESRHRAGVLSNLILVAEPHLLGVMRQHLPAELQRLISREIAGDYVHADQQQVLRLIEGSPPA